MSPDVLLSRLGLRYGGGPGDLQGTPAKIVDNLIKLTALYDADVYHTEGFATAPMSSASFDRGNVDKRATLNRAYRDAVDSGNVAAVHKAVDRYNKLLMVMSGQELVPPSDFEVAAHQQTALGDAARWIVNWAVEGGFDVERFFDVNGPAIRKYAKAAK